MAIAAPSAQTALAAPHASDGLTRYEPRLDRQRPVVAVVGENAFTELTDYVVPYSVLTAADIADVVAVATQPGPIRMFPALTLQPEATIAEFDVRFPQGADYVVVPAVHRDSDPVLIAWVRDQAAKGATVVGVCDGVWVLARAGLLHGRRATGHWYSFRKLERTFPATQWVRDRRYVADGPVVTTTGVTASIPVSLALLEAIAGTPLARKVAYEIGVAGWDAAHDSDRFRLTARHRFTAARNWLARWSHERIGILVTPGADELALALQADALSRTYRSKIFSVGEGGSVATRRGLVLVPDFQGSGAPAGTSPRVHRTIAVGFGAAALDEALADIEQRLGLATAEFVALQLEYDATDLGGRRE